MDVILIKDHERLGNKYDVVTVKDGYGRNYLIPQKMAIIANQTNMSKLDDIKAKEAAELEKVLEGYRQIAEKLEGKILKIGAKAGASGKIFGSVTNVQLASALKEQFDIDIDRRVIEFTDEVKNLGTYTAKLNLYEDIIPSLHFEVEAE